MKSKADGIRQKPLLEYGMNTDSTQSADDVNFESIIVDLMENKCGISDIFLSQTLVEKLRANLLNYHSLSEMHEAGIGKNETFDKNKAIRGDTIKWIENDSTNDAEHEFLMIVQKFVNYLNMSCFTGINGFEFHYARYEAGSFYKRHLDQFLGDSGRKFSMVFYLNENWETQWGGQLAVYFPSSIGLIDPIAGKAVFFKADELEHEVLISSHTRYSIAGWLKSN